MMPLDMQKLILSCTSAWLLVQVLKIITSSLGRKGINFRAFGSSGGMPSAHSALVSSFTASVYFIEGFSTVFLLSLLFSILVVDDALQLRQHMRKYGETINSLLKGKKRIKVYNGHTILEVCAGILIGVGIAILLF